ncbi:hypothetical protein IQ251_12545 [Saccharopolyspora sp. HNM0983]|uniref:Uncharacterized protein n=1 Tax=Saccharopolyspora montiporae TaxID=2781240 RepID=A0A929BCV6_9PSEU|nr:hypothetical protein [Saccharopolyspora sp. HNM0983]MBE9375273.1 hypothetical protein [Saccharopolyspora sp. HNM0983]
MLLDPAADRWQTWQYAERYLGAGTRDYSRFAADMDIADDYHPQRAPDAFTAPTFRIPAAEGAVLGSGIPSPAAAHYLADGEFLLPVHPEALSAPDLPGRDALLERRRGPDLLVSPSANARTVFVHRIGAHEPAPHFVKLHYPKRLSRFTRRLRRPFIALALWTTGELTAAGIPVLPETAGAVLGDDAEHSWGFLVREAAPPGEVFPPDDGEVVVPLFALYGRDVLRPQDPALLEQLVARSGEDPLRWVADRLVVPLVRTWVRSALATGCLLEMHGQNAVVRCAADGSRSEVLYRDGAVYLDDELRPGGTADPPPVNVLSRMRIPRERVHSLVYDSFLGHHALDRIALLARDSFGVPSADLRDAAREAFVDAGGMSVPLPEHVFYYDDRLHPGGGWELEDTGNKPSWRPAPRG